MAKIICGRDLDGYPCQNPRRPGQRYCRPCHAAHMRATRGPVSPEQAAHETCRRRTNYLIATGQLTPWFCVCGSLDVGPHHVRYDDPRAVVWRCEECHGREHGRTRIVRQTRERRMGRDSHRQTENLPESSSNASVARAADVASVAIGHGGVGAVSG